MQDMSVDDIHAKHSLDGYPLCWPMDKDGHFFASGEDSEVTCNDCIKIIRSFNERTNLHLPGL